MRHARRLMPAWWARLSRHCAPVLLLLGTCFGTILVADVLLAQPWAERAFSAYSWSQAELYDPARPRAADFLASHCQHVAAEHGELISHYLRPWLHRQVQEGDLSRWPGHLYLNASGAFAGQGLEIGRLMPTYFRTLEALWRDIAFPPMDLPLNAADEPLAVVEDAPATIMSFCRNPERTDILIPNLLEGEPIPVEGLRTSRAGPGDARLPLAIWRGTIIDAYAGVAKGRWALLDLGQRRPDIIDSGVVAWNADKYGPDNGRVKMKMSLATQVNEHRYTVWVAGNCASVRLARQLASDALVLKLVSPEIEWYYPLLKPDVHYLPVWVDGNETGLPEVVSWANAHPVEAGQIVEQANAFAMRHLSPLGRSCYLTRLLLRWHALQAHPFQMPTENVTKVFSLVPKLPPPSGHA